MNTLALIIDTILPGDPSMGLPPASSVDFSAHLQRSGSRALADEFSALVERACGEKFQAVFSSLSAEQRLEAINGCRISDMRLFSAFLKQVFSAYYTAPEILNIIRAGSTPPFPQGNSLESDDWSILETVYERGTIYRAPHNY
jgi:hypothetical protein